MGIRFAYHAVMPRARVQPSESFPYHVTARTPNREIFPIPIDQVWRVMGEHLYFVRRAYGLETLSFVLMSNHFHLLVRTPRANIGEGLNWFLRETSREINRLSGRINQVYGARNHKTLITNPHYFMNAYKYVYRNPVRARLARSVVEYPYSTLPGLLGRERLIIPVAEDTLLFDPNVSESTLRWLNTTPDADREDQVRRALRRSVFTLSTDRKTGRPSVLETERL